MSKSTLALALAVVAIVLGALGLVGGDSQSGQLIGASGTRFPNGISADSTSPAVGEVRGTDLTSTDDVVVGDDLTVSGKSAVAYSDDGFMASGSFTMSTNTPTASWTNSSGYDLFCTGVGGVINAKIVSGAAYAPAVNLSFGTSTAAGTPGENLVATTSLATTTERIILPSTHAFVLANGEAFGGMISDHNKAIASSTYYANWDIDWAIPCTLTEGN